MYEVWEDGFFLMVVYSSKEAFRLYNLGYKIIGVETKD